jgi:hypothetical protein
MFKAKSINKIFKRVILSFALLLSSQIPASGDVVELNPGYINGTVTVAGAQLNRVQISGSSSPYNSNTSASSNTGSSSINYSMTVNVPTGTNPVYTVNANAYSDSNYDRVHFPTQSVTTSVNSTSTANFSLNNPGFIQGNFSVTGGGTISSANLTVYAASATYPYSYTSTNSNRGQNYNVPVFPGNSLRVYARIYLTDGTNISLPQRTVNLAAGQTLTLDYTYDVPVAVTGTLSGMVTSNGPNVPNRHRVSANGPPYKNQSLNGNGSYSFSDIPVGYYYLYDYINFNNNRQYFQVPNSAYSPATTNRRYQVFGGQDTEVDIFYDQSMINGRINVTGSAPQSELSQIYVYAYGINGNPSFGGYGYDRVTSSTGDYELVLSEGNWSLNNVYLYFRNNSSDPDEYLNSQIYYRPNNSIVATTPSQSGAKDFTLPTGEVTVTFRIAGNTGTTMSNPRLSRNCTKRDENGNVEYTYGINASNGRQSNVEVGKVRFYGLEGTCKLLAQATVGGGTTTFGEVEVVVVPGTSVVVDIGGPSLTVNSPSPEYITSNASIAVTGTVTDDVQVDTVTVNGSGATLTTTNNPGDANELSFSSTVALVRGPNLITTIAKDTSDPAKEAEDKRTVYRDDGPPTLSFTPANNSTVASGGAVTTVTLSGTANDDAGIKSVSVQGVAAPFAATGNGNQVSYSGSLDLTEGENFIEVVVTDISNRSTTETHKVTVTDVDTTPPVITSPADITVNNDPGLPTAVVNFASATATDNSGSATVTQTAGPASGSAFALGTTTVSWTATDAAGNSASASTTVTVTDNEAPVVTAPAAIAVNTDAGQPTAVVNFSAATATDNVEVDSIVQTAGPASGSAFALGTTTVSWTATDAAGNSASASTTITVVDNEKPVILVPSDVTEEATGTQTLVAIGQATATDNVGVVSITSDAPATFGLGDTTVIWTATDGAGNSSSATQIVTVEDTTAPTSTFSQQVAELWPPNKKMVLVATLSDLDDAVTANPDVNISITSNQGSSADWNVIRNGGTWSIELRADRLGNSTERIYNITITVTDAAGNTATTTSTATVPHDQGQNKGGGKKK